MVFSGWCESMNKLSEERQQSARLCDEVGRLKTMVAALTKEAGHVGSLYAKANSELDKLRAENGNLIIKLAHANMDNEGARWLLEHTKTKYPFDTGDCVQWTKRRDEWLTGNGNSNNELARVEEVLVWASENVTSADKWSCDGNWTVYDDKPLGIGVNVSPTLYKALKSAWEHREKGEMSSEIENEFDRNVAELWANDRKELDRLRADNARLVGEMEQLNKALALKLDAMPSGLSAGQSMKLEADLKRHRDALEKARVALSGAGWKTCGCPSHWDEHGVSCQIHKVLTTINEVLGGGK